MPKEFFSKYLPKASIIRENRSLKWLGTLLHNANIWHLNRRSVAGAAFIGVFVCFMPIPMQMLLAAVLAIAFHCNLPLSLVLTWISNPLTFAPIYFLCYRFGMAVLGLDYSASDFNWDLDSMGQNISLIIKPLILGCFLLGLIFASSAYLFVRLMWRVHVQIKWLRRKPKQP